MVRAQLKRLLERALVAEQDRYLDLGYYEHAPLSVSTTATASTSAIWSPNWVYSPAACPAHSQRLSFATAPALCAPPESR